MIPRFTHDGIHCFGDVLYDMKSALYPGARRPRPIFLGFLILLLPVACFGRTFDVFRSVTYAFHPPYASTASAFPTAVCIRCTCSCMTYPHLVYLVFFFVFA